MTEEGTVKPTVILAKGLRQYRSSSSLRNTAATNNFWLVRVSCYCQSVCVEFVGRNERKGLQLFFFEGEQES